MTAKLAAEVTPGKNDDRHSLLVHLCDKHRFFRILRSLFGFIYRILSVLGMLLLASAFVGI